MSHKIFINLPVTDLKRSIAFYEALGANRNAAFSNDAAAMMQWTEHLHVMLLTHDFYRSFTTLEIADAHRTSQMLLAISCDDRAGVDAMVAAAAATGGKIDSVPPEDLGYMYSHSFFDPDGHAWGPFWMDPAAAENGPPSGD
jgi:predicted lactoylglutathione lyase